MGMARKWLELGPWHHFWELLAKVRIQLLFGVENDGLWGQLFQKHPLSDPNLEA